MAAAVLAVGLSAILRFVQISGPDLWVDEAFTANLIRGSLGEILRELLRDDAPPLFYFLEKGVVALLGDSAAALRALPAFAGFLTVLAAWRIAARHHPRAQALVAATAGFSALAIFYSQQARAYSLIHLAGIGLLWASIELRARPSSRRATAGFWAAATALLYSHNLGVLVVAAGVVAAGPALWRNARRPGIVLAAALAAGAIPWAWRLLQQLSIHGEHNEWIRSWWEQGRTLALAPLYSWGAFANGATPWVSPPVPLPGLPEGWGFARFVLWAAVGVGLAGAGRRSAAVRSVGGGSSAGTNVADRPPARASGEDAGGFRTAGIPADACATALVFTVVPLLGLMVVSFLTTPAYIVGRTDTIALPGFLLALGFGWTELRPRAARLAVAAVWIGAGVASILLLWSPASPRAKASDSILAANLDAAADAGDAIVLGALARPTLEYYSRRSGLWERLAWTGSFPPELDLYPAAVLPTPLDSAAVYQDRALDLRRRLETSGVDTVWVLAVRDWGPGAAGPPPVPWPRLPETPPPGRAWIRPSQIAYPMNLLVAALTGLEAAPVAWEYRQNWTGGERLVLRLERSAWVPEESIPRAEVRR